MKLPRHICTPKIVSAGRAGDGFVQALDIETDQPVRLLPGIFHLLADRRIAKQRQRHFVELNVAAAGAGERGDLLAIDAGEVGEEALGVAVSRSVGKVGAAVEMHGRGRRQGDFRRRPRHIAQEDEFIERQWLAPRELPSRVGAGEFDLVAVIIAKLEYSRLGDEAVDALDEASPIRPAAKLAVGDDAKARRFLQRNHVADRAVLDLREMPIVDAFGLMVLERLAQFDRTQQAADVVGAERRAATRTREH